MKRKLLFKRAAALLLSSTLVVSVPLTAGAVTVTDDGDYEIVFNNYGGGGPRGQSSSCRRALRTHGC